MYIYIYKYQAISPRQTEFSKTSPPLSGVELKHNNGHLYKIK